MMERILDRVRPNGDPYIDPQLMDQTVSVLVISSVLMGIGLVMTAVGIPVLGGLFVVVGGLHLGLLPPDGPVQTD